MVLYVGGTQLSGGISHAQMWNMNTAFEGGAAPIANNWSATWNSDVGDVSSLGLQVYGMFVLQCKLQIILEQI